MEPEKTTEPQLETTQTTSEETANEATAETTKKSFVDTFFDSLTKKTAEALVVTQGALERVARFLDERAKVVGELAVKLR